MKKEIKKDLVQSLVGELKKYQIIYFTGTSALNAVTDNQFRRICFEKGVKVLVVKNSLLKKAMEQITDKTFTEIYPILVGQTALLFSEVANLPAKLMVDFGAEKGKAPILKAAYIEDAIYVGKDKLQALATLKSKEELVADVVALLQAPIRNVLSALEEKNKKELETIEMVAE